MKFNCDYFKQRAERVEKERRARERARRERALNGERWFAWYPVKLGYGDCRWLEWVERYPDLSVYKFDEWSTKHYGRDITYEERLEAFLRGDLWEDSCRWSCDDIPWEYRELSVNSET